MRTKSIMSTQINHDPFHCKIFLWTIHTVRQWELFWTEYLTVERQWRVTLWALLWIGRYEHIMAPILQIYGPMWFRASFYLRFYTGGGGRFGRSLATISTYFSLSQIPRLRICQIWCVRSFIFWNACVSMQWSGDYATSACICHADHDRYGIAFGAASPRYCLMGFRPSQYLYPQ